MEPKTTGVTLEQLFGRDIARPNTPLVAVATDRVMLDGRQVAWCARHTDAPTVFLPGVPEAQHEDIRQQIVKLREIDGQFGPPSERMAQAPIVPEEMRDNDDDDDEPDEEWTLRE
jgi:hypothetical protein